MQYAARALRAWVRSIGKAHEGAKRRGFGGRCAASVRSDSVSPKRSGFERLQVSIIIGERTRMREMGVFSGSKGDVLAMSSAAQIKANRRNGARSRGPVSEAGKKRASRNRLVYTIEPRSFIAPGEDPAAFRDMARSVLEQYPPRSRFERRIVHRLIAQIWQRDRFLRIEQAVLGDAKARSKLPLALRPALDGQGGLAALSCLADGQIQLDAEIRQSLTLIIDLQRQPVPQQRPDAGAALDAKREPRRTVQNNEAEQHQQSPVVEGQPQSRTNHNPPRPAPAATPPEPEQRIKFTMQAPCIHFGKTRPGPQRSGYQD